MKSLERVYANGLVGVGMEMPWLKRTGLSLWFRAGQHTAFPSCLQIPHLVEHLVMRGPDGDPVAFTEALETQGALLNANVHRNWMAFELRSPTDTVEFGLTLLRDIVFGEVRWIKQHLEQERNIITAELASHAKDMTRRLPAEAKALLAPGSPYSVSISRQLGDLASVSLDDVRRFRESHLTPNNAFLLVCGSQTERVLDSAERILANLPAGRSALVPKLTLTEAGVRRTFADRGGTNAVAVAFKAPPYSSPDREVLGLAYGLLTFGMGSRLFREVVLDKAVTYQVFADIEHSDSYGMAVFYARVRNADGVPVVLEALERHVKEIAEGRFTERELIRARERYLTHLCLIEERPDEAFRRHGRHYMYTGNLFDLEAAIRRLRTVDSQEIVGAWRRYMDWSQSVVSTVVGGGELVGH